MKKREHQQTGSGSSPPMGLRVVQVQDKNKMWEEKESVKQPSPLFDTGVDELLAVLGYKVRSSDMAEVAQKIDQLEMALGCDSQENELLSHLSSDTVHYNPSDLSTWLQSMLSEINPNPSPNLDDPVLAAFSASLDNSSVIFTDPGLDDLRAIPGGAICDPEREKKRLKTITSQTSQNILLQKSQNLSESPRPVVIVDSQENGIRLVHTLLACAEAIQHENFQLAEALVNQIGLLAVSQAGAMRKVATYFGEALARRIYRYAQDSIDSTSISELLELHFYETCPYLKFAHFTANQAILEAFEGRNHVHVIDFSMKQGVQWPALIQALALRPGGPPTFRLTAIGPPQPDNTDALQQVGWRLAQLAETVHIEFEYRGFVTNSLADIDAEMLNLRANEIVAVNSVFEFHKLLCRPGAIEKVLASIVAMKPKIVTMVEQEANHNGLVFLDRFTESLHYYSTMFDSLEGIENGTNSHNLNMTRNKEDQMMSEVYLGKQIYNVVACEGVERIERHETLSQWRVRMKAGGFEPVHMGSNAFRQASMLLSLFGGVAGYKVEENQGCLTLGWHSRPLIATSAWKVNELTQ